MWEVALGLINKGGVWLTIGTIILGVLFMGSLATLVGRVVGAKATTQAVAKPVMKDSPGASQPTAVARDVSGQQFSAKKIIAPVVNADHIEHLTYHVHSDILGTSITEEEVELQIDEVEVDAKVWVLWDDASWHVNNCKYNENSLNRFLESDNFREHFRSADGIACIGLASSKMTEQLRRAPDRDQKMLNLSQDRARTLCQRVAYEVRGDDSPVAVFGLGIGYNSNSAVSDKVEKKQRALMLVHVTSSRSDYRMTKEEIRSAIAQILQMKMRDVKPSEYSEIAANHRLDWMMIEQGTMAPEPKSCVK